MTVVEELSDEELSEEELAERLVEMKRGELLNDLSVVADEIDLTATQLDELKQRRDRLVASARDVRVPYQAIADRLRMSISWINSSLVRSEGYRPRAGRPRRR